MANAVKNNKCMIPAFFWRKRVTLENTITAGSAYSYTETIEKGDMTLDCVVCASISETYYGDVSITTALYNGSDADHLIVKVEIRNDSALDLENLNISIAII